MNPNDHIETATGVHLDALAAQRNVFRTAGVPDDVLRRMVKARRSGAPPMGLLVIDDDGTVGSVYGNLIEWKIDGEPVKWTVSPGNGHVVSGTVTPTVWVLVEEGPYGEDNEVVGVAATAEQATAIGDDAETRGHLWTYAMEVAVNGLPTGRTIRPYGEIMFTEPRKGERR